MLPTRDQLDACTVRHIHEARGLRPHVRVVRVGDQLGVLKDYSRCPLLHRELLGRWLARREYAAFKRLHGVPGIPRALGMIDAYAFVCEYIEGTCGSLFHRDELPPAFFARLHDVIAAIHRAGLAHGDLKRRRNILVGDGYHPYLVDFATAVPKRPRWDAFGNWVFRQLCQIDFNAAAKLKRRIAPETLTPQERRGLDFPTFLERWAKRVLGR